MQEGAWLEPWFEKAGSIQDPSAARTPPAASSPENNSTLLSIAKPSRPSENAIASLTGGLVPVGLDASCHPVCESLRGCVYIKMQTWIESFNDNTR